MNKVAEPEFDELGAQLGRALRSRVAAQRFSPPEMHSVHAGARRRRAAHRGGAGLVCLALVAAAGFALARRTDQTVPGDDGGAPVGRPPILPAYAVLDGAPGVDAPTAMWTQRGGQAMGLPVPRIDVWQSGDQRLVIRSVDNRDVLPAPGVTTTVVATTVVASPGDAWAGRPVTDVKVRGTDGALESLGADQFAVWVPASSDQYTLVIGRGMSSDQLLADVESLVVVDGVLQPAAGFTRVESAGALPATTPAPAFAEVAHGRTGGPFIGTNTPLAGRSSIETVGWIGVGRLEQIDGLEAMVTDERMGNSPSVTWLDPSGVVVNVTAQNGSPEDLVPFVHLVGEAEWTARGAALSARLTADLAVADQVTIGSVLLTRRGSTDGGALCLVAAGSESCVADTTGESPVSLSDQAEINGQWVIYGYRQVLPEEESYLTTDDLRFTSSDGSCCTVEATKHNGAYWYVVHVDDDVDVIETNLGLVFGGIVGSITRPLVASSF